MQVIRCFYRPLYLKYNNGYKINYIRIHNFVKIIKENLFFLSLIFYFYTDLHKYFFFFGGLVYTTMYIVIDVFSLFFLPNYTKLMPY